MSSSDPIAPSTPLKPVLRKATEKDTAKVAENEAKEAEALRVCAQKIETHKLDMNLVSVEYTFDVSKIIFYFTAEGRVDFRDLVKDLAGIPLHPGAEKYYKEAGLLQ